VRIVIPEFMGRVSMMIAEKVAAALNAAANP
jgi:hypothetical protein